MPHLLGGFYKVIIEDDDYYEVKLELFIICILGSERRYLNAKSLNIKKVVTLKISIIRTGFGNGDKD